MSAIPPTSLVSKLTKLRKKGYFRRLSPYTGDNLPKILREIEEVLLEQSRAIDEMQSLQVAARETDDAGRPVDGARCESFDGQFIRLLQYDPSPVYTRVKHKLGRVPQGAILVASSAASNRVYIEGDPFLNISPASDTEITVALFGNIGDDHTFILF